MGSKIAALRASGTGAQRNQMSNNSTFSAGHIKTVNCGSSYGRMQFWEDGAKLTVSELATDGDDIEGGAVFCVLSLNEGKAYFYRAWNYADFSDFCSNASSVFCKSDELTEHSRNDNILVLS